jgi:hypothetical protein
MLLQTPLCLGCSYLFIGGHNTRQESKKLPIVVVGFWSNENLPSLYPPGDSKEKNYWPATEIMSPFL